MGFLSFWPGVLDPLELSTLSTRVDRPVSRGGRELLSGGLDCINELPDMQALEDNLFKELPPNTLADGGMAARVFSPKPVSLARDEAGPASVVSFSKFTTLLFYCLSCSISLVSFIALFKN